MIWHIPQPEPNLGLEVMILSDPDLWPNCCEYNVDSYIRRFGGTKIQGVYVLKHNRLPMYQLVKHFVVHDGVDFLDVTPFEDGRTQNYFIPCEIIGYNIYVQTLAHINNYSEQESEHMYYVYCYLDPENRQPFYVGKGTQNRAYTHMYLPRDKRKNKNKTRFKNKLEKMKSQGIEPVIIFLAQNILDEEIAYAIEESFIKQYGRLGYEENGILLNTCLGSRPPSHRGKTYEEIYGPEKAKLQREMRSRLQKERGGYGPKKHSEEARRKFSQNNTGSGNPMFGRHHSEETKEKIRNNRKTVAGGDHHMSKHWILTSPQGEVHEQVGNLASLCEKLNISFSTMHAAFANQRIPKFGSAKGWTIAVKQDVDDNSFKGFTL